MLLRFFVTLEFWTVFWSAEKSTLCLKYKLVMTIFPSNLPFFFSGRRLDFRGCPYAEVTPLTSLIIWDTNQDEARKYNAQKMAATTNPSLWEDRRAVETWWFSLKKKNGGKNPAAVLIRSQFLKKIPTASWVEWVFFWKGANKKSLKESLFTGIFGWSGIWTPYKPT